MLVFLGGASLEPAVYLRPAPECDHGQYEDDGDCGEFAAIRVLIGVSTGKTRMVYAGGEVKKNHPHETVYELTPWEITRNHDAKNTML